MRYFAGFISVSSLIFKLRVAQSLYIVNACVCVCRCRYNANVSLQQFVSLLGVDRGRGKKGRGRGQLNHIVNMEIEARELNGAHNAALLSGFMRACTHFARARTRRDLLCGVIVVHVFI